jgi:uncharacterized phiE125 gp8 family phage protein
MQFELAPFALPADYGEGIISLDAMKAHLAVTFDDQDSLIEAFRDAAVDMVERYCALYLAARIGVIWRGEALPSPLDLSTGPVTAITTVRWLDESGDIVTGTASDWRILRAGTIALKPGKTLPTGIGGGVEITFAAGFTDANRPAALVQAVKLFAAHLYKHREAVSSGTMSGEIPFGFRHLCGLYRVPVI